MAAKEQPRKAVAAAVAPLFSQVLCEVVPTEPRWGGRKVVATDPLAAGVSAMRERGLAVLAEGSDPDKVATHCGYCFRALVDGEVGCCAEIAKALAPIEDGPAAKVVRTLARDKKIQSSLLRIWVRVIAACVALHPDKESDPTTRKRLADWIQAVRGCAELDTSAPGPEWLYDVFEAATLLCEAVPNDLLGLAAEVVVPAISTSSAGQGKAEDGGNKAPMTMAEALIIIAGQLNRNGYSVRDVLQPNSIVAFGLFPAVAMFNHSCAPNCAVVTFPDGHLEVRTLRPIPAGGELTVSYIDLLLPREERILELQASKEFHCHCLRCDCPDAFSHERFLSTPLCPRCHRTAPRPLMIGVAVDENPSQFVCRTEDGGCCAVLERAAAEAPLKGIRDMLNSDPGSGGKLVLLQRALKHTTSILPSEHCLVIRTRLNLALILERNGLFSECAGQLSAALAAMSNILDPAWPEQAEWWAKLGRVRIDEYRAAGTKFAKGGAAEARAKAKQHAVEAFSKAHSALRVCGGGDHPLTASLKKELEGAMRLE